MATPYYTGDPVALKFTVRQKGAEEVKVTGASASLYGPKGEIFVDAPTEIDGNVVRLEIGGGSTSTSGDYRVEFVVNIAPDIERTHPVTFRVLQREPIFSDEMDRELMPVDELSSDYEVNGAIGNAIRQLRRAGVAINKANEITTDLAQKMTNRRI